MSRVLLVLLISLLRESAGSDHPVCGNKYGCFWQSDDKPQGHQGKNAYCCISKEGAESGKCPYHGLTTGTFTDTVANHKTYCQKDKEQAAMCVYHLNGGPFCKGVNQDKTVGKAALFTPLLEAQRKQKSVQEDNKKKDQKLKESVKKDTEKEKKLKKKKKKKEEKKKKKQEKKKKETETKQLHGTLGLMGGQSGTQGTGTFQGLIAVPSVSDDCKEFTGKKKTVTRLQIVEFLKSKYQPIDETNIQECAETIESNKDYKVNIHDPTNVCKEFNGPKKKIVKRSVIEKFLKEKYFPVTDSYVIPCAEAIKLNKDYKVDIANPFEARYENFNDWYGFRDYDYDDAYYGDQYYGGDYIEEYYYDDAWYDAYHKRKERQSLMKRLNKLEQKLNALLYQ